MATALERSRLSLGFCALCLGAALGLVTPSAAHAYEDKAGLALDLGYARATERNAAHNGGLVGVEASIGLDDIWTVRAAVTYSLHPGTSSQSVLAISGELLYLIDVLELVPYFGAGIDAVGS
ncbi:MAG TPA: hypothetical protein VHZ95_12935, partial [Polyangiales bacterium]|nr:hypothetical protein [Polyangiales bacterium]